jgi:hypothetical protein
LFCEYSVTTMSVATATVRENLNRFTGVSLVHHEF